MKRLLIIAATLGLLVAGCSNSDGPGRDAQVRDGLLRHVVMFKFKEGTTAQDLKQVEDAFAALPGKISEIQAFEWGTNVSPEKHDQGYTHCFLLTFKSEADRDAYLVHPAHKEFGALAGPHFAGVHVLDYWARR